MEMRAVVRGLPEWNAFSRWVSVGIGVSVVPFLWLLTQMERMGGARYAMGNIVGLVGALLLLWQMVLGNRALFARVNRDFVGMVKLHMFLGIYGTVLILAHPLLEMVAYGADWRFLVVPDLSSELGEHISFGRMAIILFLVIWVSSALLRSRIRYRPWRYIHYLTYPMMGLVFVHAGEIGTFLRTYPVIRGYWYGMMLVFAGLLTWRVTRVLNVGKRVYELKSKARRPDGISVYEFEPVGAKIVPEVGQFVYVKRGFLSESHPFSVMEFDEESGKLVFGIKKVGRFTNEMEELKKGARVYMDGPYGVFTKAAQNKGPKVIIAGGIGVTPFVELVKRFGGRNTYMFYANRKLGDAVKRQELRKVLGDNYVDAVSQEEVRSKTVIGGRISEEELERRLPKKYLEEAVFLVCGSPGFMAGILAILAKLSVSEGRTYTEEFGF